MARLKILQEIDKLQNEHCLKSDIHNKKYNNASSGTNICRTKCKVGKEMQKLGDKLLSIGSEKRRRRIKETLKKGRDMTASDIEYLKSQEVSGTKIARAMKMDKKRVFEIIRSLEDAKEMNNFEKVKKLTKKGLKAKEI